MLLGKMKIVCCTFFAYYFFRPGASFSHVVYIFKKCDLPVAFFCISLYSFKNCDLPICQSLCCFLFYRFYPFVFAKVLHFLHVWLGCTLFTWFLRLFTIFCMAKNCYLPVACFSFFYIFKIVICQSLFFAVWKSEILHLFFSLLSQKKM